MEYSRSPLSYSPCHSLSRLLNTSFDFPLNTLSLCPLFHIEIYVEKVPRPNKVKENESISRIVALKRTSQIRVPISEVPKVFPQMEPWQVRWPVLCGGPGPPNSCLSMSMLHCEDLHFQSRSFCNISWIPLLLFILHCYSLGLGIHHFLPGIGLQLPNFSPHFPGPSFPPCLIMLHCIHSPELGADASLSLLPSVSSYPFLSPPRPISSAKMKKLNWAIYRFPNPPCSLLGFGI